jgi:hypothetical protein
MVAIGTADSSVAGTNHAGVITTATSAVPLARVEVGTGLTANGTAGDQSADACRLPRPVKRQPAWPPGPRSRAG